MVKQKYVYWKDEDMWLGYLEDYPDYWTQAETEEELKENFIDVYKDSTSGSIPNVRQAPRWCARWRGERSDGHGGGTVR